MIPTTRPAPSDHPHPPHIHPTAIGQRRTRQEREAPGARARDVVAEIEQRGGDAAEDDGEFQPREEGALGGEVDFRLDADGDVDAFAGRGVEAGGGGKEVGCGCGCGGGSGRGRGRCGGEVGEDVQEAGAEGREGVLEQGGGVVPAAEALGFFEGGVRVVAFVVGVVERVVVGVRVGWRARPLFHVERVRATRVEEVLPPVHVVLLEGVAGFAEAAHAFVVVGVVGGWESVGVGGGDDHVFFVGVVVEQVVAGGVAGRLARAFDAEAVRDGFADVGVHLGHPEREKVDSIWEESGGAVDEFAEFGDGLDKMTTCELPDPFWRCLTGLGLQLNFEHGVGEAFDILRRKS